MSQLILKSYSRVYCLAGGQEGEYKKAEITREKFRNLENRSKRPKIKIIETPEEEIGACRRGNNSRKKKKRRNIPWN